MSKQKRIDKTLEIAMSYGGIDGAHHKDWTLDQMVRALTGCPMETHEATDSEGNPYTYESQGESDEYQSFVAEACDGEDGPETYTWEEGTPP